MKIDDEKIKHTFPILDKILGNSSIAFKQANEDTIHLFHKKFGSKIREELGLWDNRTRAASYLNKLGVSHSKARSWILLLAFHRFLNDEDMNIDKELRKYISHRDGFGE